MPRFEINRDWLKEVVESDEVLDLLDDLGAEVVARAKHNARQAKDTGAFEESIKAEFMLSPKEGRPYVRIYSDDPGALSIEFGNSRQLPHRALGRAINSF